MQATWGQAGKQAEKHRRKQVSKQAKTSNRDRQRQTHLAKLFLLSPNFFALAECSCCRSLLFVYISIIDKIKYKAGFLIAKFLSLADRLSY